MATTRLLVVRHGESTWNAEGRWQGQADPPLSERGERQAAEASEQLGEVLHGVWSSDLVRARQTAEILAGGHAGLAVHVDERLREREAGAWTGLTRDEIETRYPGYLADGLRPPGWEPDETLRARVSSALADIASGAPDGGIVLVVTHGGMLRVVAASLGAEPEGVPNLGGRWLEVTSSGLALGERVVLVTHEVTTPRQM